MTTCSSVTSISPEQTPTLQFCVVVREQSHPHVLSQLSLCLRVQLFFSSHVSLLPTLIKAVVRLQSEVLLYPVWQVPWQCMCGTLRH